MESTSSRRFEVEVVVSTKGRLIDTKDMPLEEWLELLRKSPRNAKFINYMFPSDRQSAEFLASVNGRSEEEVRFVLEHLLWLPVSFGLDKLTTQILMQRIKEEGLPNPLPQLFQRLLNASKNRPVWDGTRWVLDLLPENPRACLDALRAYLIAYAYALPDGRFQGLVDAMAVVRAKYIERPPNGHELDAVTPREFEFLVAELYARMGYDTITTKQSRDGGKDVIALRKEHGRREYVLIQAKHQRGKVSEPTVSHLLGVVSDEKANRGILVTSSAFTRPAEKFAARNPRLDLVDGSHLHALLNEHCGTNWRQRVDAILGVRLRKHGSHKI